MNNITRSPRPWAAVVLAGVLVASGCSGNDDDSADAMEDAAFDMAGDSGGDDGGDDAESAASEAGGVAAPEAAGFELGQVGRDVIVEMRVVLESDDIERTVSAVSASASALGGGIASSDVSFGRTDGEQTGYAVLVVRVPPDAVDRLIDGLDDSATLRSINQSAQDVTDQVIDLEVRIDNARESVASVRDFMSRTENLDELVRLEAELTRRQTDLERLEAQQRNIDERVALATVSIEILPAEPVVEPVEVEEDDGVTEALRSGWEAFATVLVAIVIVLATLLPFLLLSAVIGGIAWLILRRRARPSRPREPVPVQEDEPSSV